ncbi:MAG TPA: hypothetical protein VEA80_19520 [Vitreimonas sp.]|uniref:hypothetical protein n=1 Tax=Vitreimonas sp. TaxID=3069702 RepID=UPI002D431272|nr:hypothetical protein [Vitreimonas sp.]HYD89680.1 hypothetical protein [Vitreimonas sp.]
MSDANEQPQSPREALNRVVELARQALRERGFSEAEIDALLSRRTAPEFER